MFLLYILKVGDWESFAILEHLPYSEAYDLALQKWENENDCDMDSYEVFAGCQIVEIPLKIDRNFWVRPNCIDLRNTS